MREIARGAVAFTLPGPLSIVVPPIVILRKAIMVRRLGSRRQGRLTGKFAGEVDHSEKSIGLDSLAHLAPAPRFHHQRCGQAGYGATPWQPAAVLRRPDGPLRG